MDITFMHVSGMYMKTYQLGHSKPCGADKCMIYEVKEVAPKEDKERKKLIFRYNEVRINTVAYNRGCLVY